MKAAQEALVAKVAAQYGKLGVDEIKALVVDDKWMGTLAGAVQGELRGALEQALLRARDQGCDLRVALRSGAGAIRPLVLPPGVRWGLPRGVPPPPGMALGFLHHHRVRFLGAVLLFRRLSGRAVGDARV